MANTLTVLVPTLIASMQRVLRQRGAIFNAFSRNFGAEPGALGQTLSLPRAAAVTAATVTPAATPPALPGDTTPTAESLILSQYKKGAFNLTGEDWKSIGANGPSFRVAMIDEAIAAVVNEAALYAWGVAEINCARAIGAAGTGPFASNPNNAALAWKTLFDYQAPSEGRVGIVSSTDYNAMLNLAQFQKMNEAPAGVDFATARIGQLADFLIQPDQALAGNHTAGSGASYLVNMGSGAAVGATSITVDGGSGTILAGDVVHFGTDTDNKYVVKTALAANVFVLHTGLVAAVANDATVTVQASHRANIFAHPDAFALGWRPPVTPPDGDAATMVQIITDPVTRLSMRLAYYPGYHAGQYEVSAIYGASRWRATSAAKIIG